MRIERGSSLSDRYRFDFHTCTIAKGWAQLDTKQDASYYGTWASPTERVILNYAEGDVTRTICETDEEFVQQMREWEGWVNGAGYGPAKVDAGSAEFNAGAAELIAQFSNLGLADLLH